ncbi:HEPN domain-containing protein [Arachidicoccus sp.]|uniref:HEPN domain-containing protein n=1 Tax=Arachidicoccus sp. TaxID=1872624 RepID=UPI003D1B95FF
MENGNSRVLNITNNVFIGAEAKQSALKDWKGWLASIVENITQGEDELKPLIQLLVATIQPTRIYRINHPKITNETYIDLLIIVASSNEKPFVELEPILEIPYVSESIVCCSLYNEGNLKEDLSNGHLFYSLHCLQENIIYDNSKSQYPVPSSEMLEQMKKQISHNFKQDIQRAIDFKEMAAYLLEKNHSKITSFLLHQATELTYRSVLKNLNGFDKKTHALQALRKYICRCAPQLCTIFSDDTEEDKQLNNLLEDAYTAARYDRSFKISRELLAKIFEKVTNLQQVAIELVAIQTE